MVITAKIKKKHSSRVKKFIRLNYFSLRSSCCIVIKKRFALDTKPKQGGIIQMSVHTGSEAEVKCMAKKVSSRLKCLAFNRGCSFVGDVTVHKPADMTWIFVLFSAKTKKKDARQCRPPNLSTFCFTIFGSLT